MNLQSHRELEATREKRRLLEERFEAGNRPPRRAEIDWSVRKGVECGPRRRGR